MQQRHIPPPGEFIAGGKHSTGAECPCKPRRVPVTKQAASGRGGRHQGYKVIRIDWFHNPLNEPREEDL